jgi:hypothetical protein
MWPDWLGQGGGRGLKASWNNGFGSPVLLGDESACAAKRLNEVCKGGQEGSVCYSF